MVSGCALAMSRKGPPLSPSLELVQQLKRSDEGGLVVGDDAASLEIEPDIAEILGDEAEVLGLGPPGKDLAADHQKCRGDDLAQDLSMPRTYATLPRQRLEVT